MVSSDGPQLQVSYIVTTKEDARCDRGKQVLAKISLVAALRGRLYAHGLLLGVGVPSGKGPLRVNVRNGNSVRVRSVLESELSHWKVEGGNFV